MKKGFTLVELLGVIALLGLLVIVVYPVVLEQIEKKQNEVDSAKLELIYSSVDTYMGRNPETYPERVGNQYCISLDTLVLENMIAIDISDINKRYVQVTMGANHNVTHRLLEKCNEKK